MNKNIENNTKFNSPLGFDVSSAERFWGSYCYFFLFFPFPKHLFTILSKIRHRKPNHVHFGIGCTVLFQKKV